MDFINVMAYDGGDGERHFQYQFAMDCRTYWKETWDLPAHKVVLGIPVYARSSCADYGSILAAVAGDLYNGMEVYDSGVDTIAEKTRYAREHLGRIMIWNLTQDATGWKKNLL